MTRIANPSLSWTPENVPFSTVFEDTYYNRKRGLEESRQVYLAANNLPQAWNGQRQFTIAETGFGTGLNFLATWQMFEETTTTEQRLDFVSVEKFPMEKNDLLQALQPFADALGQERVQRLLKIYPLRIPGFHRLWVTDRVTLTLIFDDALRGFSQFDALVDAWFLDGFAPKRNNDIWQQELFAQMARLSHGKTTLASFTAAGDVRRGLKEAGFSVRRVDGFGYKYHRTVGTFNGAPKADITPPRQVTIIGAGLAGAATACALKRRGVAVQVVDHTGQPAQGASSNLLGLVNPKIEAQDNARTDFGQSCFAFANHVLHDLQGISLQANGALHLAYDDANRERLQKLLTQSDWLAPHMQWIEANKTKEVCGVALPHDGLFFPDALGVCPHQLVQTMLAGQDIATDAETNDIIIHASGWGLHKLPELQHLRLQPVRGQVTYAAHSDVKLKCPVMFGRYAAPTLDGKLALGASFVRDVDTADIRAGDDAANIAETAKMLQQPVESFSVTGHWAQIRTTIYDRMPIVGSIADKGYVIGALGSHGIQYALMLGEILACQLTGAPLPIGKNALETVALDRFAKRKSP